MHGETMKELGMFPTFRLCVRRVNERKILTRNASICVWHFWPFGYQI